MNQVETQQNPITKSQRNKGRVLIVVTALLWGLAGVCVKSITWNSMSIMAARSIPSLIMALIAKGSIHLKFSKQNVLAAIMTTLTGTLYIGSIKLTTAGTAIVLQYVAPILIFVYSVVFQKYKAKWYEALVTLAVFAGIVLSFADSLDPTRLLGNALGLMSGVTFAAQIILMNKEEVDNSDVVAFSNIFSLILCAPFLFFDKNLVFDFQNVIWILILGIFQFGLANVCFAKGIKLVNKIEGSLLLTIEPIFNPIPVAIICHEMMGKMAIFGSAIVIVFVTLYGLLPTIEEKIEEKKQKNIQGEKDTDNC